MRSVVLSMLASVCAVSVGYCDDPDDWLLGHWPFNGSLEDASGKGHHASGEAPRFVEGQQSQALKLDWGLLEIANTPDLQLAPGLTIDCWVYFDEKPTGYQPIVIKANEYQLRLDDQREGGRLVFFVYLDGWEPRVGSVVAEAGQWYHLLAKWTGSEISLEVNGDRASAQRVGTPRPTDIPVMIGKLNCRVDELKLSNPSLGQVRAMQSMVAKTPDGARLKQTHFGEGAGWKGWRPEWGASMNLEAGALAAHFPDSHGVLLNPDLDVDARQNAWVSLDIRSKTARRATLVFVTDVGHGMASLPVWDLKRTCIVDLASHPNWRGRLKLLGLSLPDGDPHEATIENLWLSSKPEGSPFLYVRNLAPGRAITRVGRDEKIIAVLRNLGAEAGQVQATLHMPEHVRIIDGETRTIADMPRNSTETVEWTVRADRPATGDAKVTLSPPGAATEKSIPVEFEPPADVPAASYVPRPTPAESERLLLMHYCPLWKAGTHYGWQRIEPWPERRPAIGWYDEGTPEVADWHIKYALEHGVQGFIYCWYRRDFSPEINVNLGHALHDGLLHAKYLDMFKFVIMWENGCAKGVKDRDDMMNNVLPFWIENYFTHPSYVKIDNKPLLYVWRPERVGPELGGSEATRAVFDEMRAECRKHGFDGLHIVGCVSTANESLLARMAEEGWDASSAYATWASAADKPGMDLEGVTTISHRSWSAAQQDVWRGKKNLGALPDIANIMMGWDPRPWHGPRTRSYQAGATPDSFRAACLDAKRIVDATPGNGLDKRLVVFDNWNEFGEGHYLEPCTGFGFGFLDAIRDVFCDETEPCAHLIPEDVGLEPPERVYRARREILGVGVRKNRKVVDNLVAWWRFDDDDEHLARDSSDCGFDGFKQYFQATDGVSGQGFLCRNGSVTLGPDDLLFPRSGITVELWLKTDEPDQQDRWMVNTVGQADSGYRLGLVGGKIGWQIPQTAWSHMLASPEPVPLGQWIHVAATHDNETMRLFINGNECGTLERPGGINPSGASLCLGSYAPGHTTAHFIGVLDEITIHDRALSAAEIAERHRRYAP